MRFLPSLLALAALLACSTSCSDSEPAPPAQDAPGPASPPHVFAAEASAPRAEAPPEPDIGPQPAPEPEPADSPLVLRVTQPLAGDWDAIAERGVLRVLVSHSRTNFFLAKGRVRGFEYEMFRELEEYLARHRASGRASIVVAFVPLPFDELLPALLEGRGDVAAAALTITPERARRVDFTAPYLQGVEQILVAHRDAPPVRRWSDLCGQEVHVLAGSSYLEHLEAINADLVAGGLEPIRVRPSARGLTTEDLLELVSSGGLAYTVADRYLAELWSGVLEGLRLEAELVADREGSLAWAVRPGSPQLKAELDGFVAENRKGTLIGNVLFKRYYDQTIWIRNPLLDVEGGKLAPYLEPIQRLSEQYGYDWRLIAAQAYQESQLDPNTVSSSGAVGLMQLLPSTAADMGFHDLRDPEDNLHAGIKYMDWLRRNFFDEPQLPHEVQVDFALAAYNAGPSRVRRWRETAPSRGLDPDRWFGNVELLALEDVGMQPVQYVGNINKYFVLLSLAIDDALLRQRELERLREEAGE